MMVSFCHLRNRIDLCSRTVLLEKTLESSLDCKEIKPINPKGNQSWIFIGRTDAEAEAPILWPPDGKNWLNGKDPDGWEKLKAGGEGGGGEWDGWVASPNQWRWVSKLQEIVMDRELVCCSPQGHKELDTTERLNNNEVPHHLTSNRKYS